MPERARLDALLRHRPVVLLDVLADPGEDLRRHADAVHGMAAVEPAPRLLRAHGDVERQADAGHGMAAGEPAPRLLRAHGDVERQAAIVVHAPEDEYARRRSRDVEVIALGFVAMELQREPGMQPLREARLVEELPRRAAFLAREHAPGFPHAVD